MDQQLKRNKRGSVILEMNFLTIPIKQFKKIHKKLFEKIIR